MYRYLVLSLAVILFTMLFGEAKAFAEADDARRQSEEVNVRSGPGSVGGVEGGVEGSKGVSFGKEYLLSYLTDTAHIITSPLRWDSGDWRTAGAFLLITGGLFAADEEFRDFVQDKRNDTTNDLADIFNKFGDTKSAALPVYATLGIYGAYTGNRRAIETTLLGVESYVITGLFTQAFKFGFHRHRPRTDDGFMAFDGPSRIRDNLSFFSGHASSAFSLATVIATQYSDYRIVPYIAYGAATLTALTRMNYDAHWASDVFVGAAAAYFISKTVLKLHSSTTPGALTLTPSFNGETTYVNLTYRF